MSRSRNDREALLAYTDLFFFPRGGRREEEAAEVIDAAERGRLALRTSSEVYGDAVSAMRSDGYPLELAHDFVSDMRSIPHSALPMSAEVVQEALHLHLKQGGGAG